VAGQTEANEIENGGTLDPGVCLGGAIEASITIDLGRTGHIRIHSRLAEHDIVGRAIAMGNISLMHKLKAFAYLGEEGDEFVECSDLELIERA